eukprot:10978460-Alexandrium_andersonii.AAC.1
MPSSTLRTCTRCLPEAASSSPEPALRDQGEQRLATAAAAHRRRHGQALQARCGGGTARWGHSHSAATKIKCW